MKKLYIIGIVLLLTIVSSLLDVMFFRTGLYQNITGAFMLFFLARIQGALYFINNIDETIIVQRVKGVIKTHTSLFLIAFLYVLISIISMSGFAVESSTQVVFVAVHKYLHNLIEMPWVLGLLVMGALLVLWAIFATLFLGSKRAIWLSGLGSVLVGMSIFLIAGFNNTAYYPSLADMQSSLTIANSSSSRFTLVTMSYVSLMVPFVLGYIIWAWKAMDSQKMTIKEVESDPHHY